MELLDSCGIAGNPRAKTLASAFIAKYGTPPAFVARAPGRVNLIGEHVDYCGYSVLPMAIEQDVVMAVLPIADDSSVMLANVNPAFADASFSSQAIPEITVQDTGPAWHQYFMCGYRGVLEALSLASSMGLRILVDGVVPPSAGLSSSSAMVCCSAIVTLWTNVFAKSPESVVVKDARGQEVSRKWLADVCRVSERYIGTQGGGMDQAICLLATSGKAKRVDFQPLNVTDVKLPSDCVFVVTNSCVKANKAAFADFNIRVVECRLAAKILARHLGLESWAEVTKLRQVQEAGRKTLEEMLRLVDTVLRLEVFHKTEIMRFLDYESENEFDEACLTANTRHVTQFALRQRATHVFSEAARVLQFQAICDQVADDAGSGEGGHLAHLGALMDQSHASCRDLYQCSYPDLDKLVDLCRGAKASHLGALCFGSRLTGAGWGGCCVSLVRAEGVKEFVDVVKREYYLPRGIDSTGAVIVSTPSAGAAVFQ